MTLIVASAFHPVTITCGSIWSVGSEVAAAGAGGGASAAWPSANRIIYIPFYVNQKCLARKISWINGTAVAGNVTVGIYNSALGRLVTSGTIAQSGVSSVQTADITDTDLSPGTYWMAMLSSSASAQFMRTNTNVGIMRMSGMFEESGTFFLNSTATVTPLSTNYMPLMSVSLRTVTGSP